MMDNPEFRAQMLEAAGSMGAGKMAQLKDTLESNSDLVDSLQQLGPSLGTALDILMRSTTAEEFDEACTTLDGLCRRLADKGRDDIKYRRLRLTNGALQQRLLRHDAGQSCLEALGFRNEVEVEGEAYLEHSGEGLDRISASASGGSASLHGGALGRELDVIAERRQEAIKAALINREHGVAYEIAVELPNIRRACGGDQELGQLLTQVLLHNDEFRMHSTGAAAEIAMPHLLQMLRSKRGITGLVEYYTGEALEETRVVRVQTVSEWKEALANAGERPVCALFATTSSVACRVLMPSFSRLPEVGKPEAEANGEAQAAEDKAEGGGMPGGDFDGVEFLLVCLDSSKDDGLCEAVFEEAYVSPKSVPTFVFLTSASSIASGGTRGRTWPRSSSG